MFVLKRLFYGKNSLENLINSWWINTKGFFYAYLLTWFGLGLASYFFIREMWQYLLTCYLLIGIILGIFIIIANFFIILNSGSIVATIKGKGSKLSVILLTCLALATSFLLFVTVLNLNLNNQKDLALFRNSEKS